MQHVVVVDTVLSDTRLYAHQFALAETGPVVNIC